jgi:hypothetical protein
MKKSWFEKDQRKERSFKKEEQMKKKGWHEWKRIKWRGREGDKNAERERREKKEWERDW